MTMSAFLGECPVIRPEGIYYGGRKVIQLTPGLSDTSLSPGHYQFTVPTLQGAAVAGWAALNSATVSGATTTFSDATSVTIAFDVTSPTMWPSTLPTPQRQGLSPTLLKVAYVGGAGLILLGAYEIFGKKKRR